MILKLASYLEDQLTKKLPGEMAHGQMAPIHRPSPDEARQWNDTKLSGVLVLMYPFENRIYIALMMRPEYGGVHSGQVSFPGGRKEKHDNDIRQTALREAHEELGIVTEKVTVVGHLSELYIPPSKSLVTPVLAYTEEKPEFIPDEREVKEVIEADLFDLFQEKYFNNTEIVTSKYLLKEVPAITYNGYIIWGATAMILNEFKWLLKGF